MVGVKRYGRFSAAAPDGVQRLTPVAQSLAMARRLVSESCVQVPGDAQDDPDPSSIFIVSSVSSSWP